MKHWYKTNNKAHYFNNSSVWHLASKALTKPVCLLAARMDGPITHWPWHAERDPSLAYAPGSLVDVVTLCVCSSVLVVACLLSDASLATVARWRMVVHHLPFLSPLYQVTKYLPLVHMVSGILPKIKIICRY